MTCKLQTDNPRGNSLVKMAMHGVADLPMQALQVIGLGENGLPQRTCGKPAFRCGVYKKNKLMHAIYNSSIRRCLPGQAARTLANADQQLNARPGQAP